MATVAWLVWLEAVERMAAERHLGEALTAVDGVPSLPLMPVALLRLLADLALSGGQKVKHWLLVHFRWWGVSPLSVYSAAPLEVVTIVSWETA